MDAPSGACVNTSLLFSGTGKEPTEYNVGSEFLRGKQNESPHVGCCADWLPLGGMASGGKLTSGSDCADEITWAGSIFRPAILNRPLKVVSFDSRKSNTLTLLNSHVSKTLARTRYSLSDASVNLPLASRRCFANRLIACSALLLFQGTPS